MTLTLITDNIDQLRATEAASGWMITFRSTNTGYHHQLYANGRLVDWTESLAQRTMYCDAAAYPYELIVAAVSSGDQTADLSDQLPQEPGTAAYVFEASVVRSPMHPRGSRLLVLGDRATGQLGSEPLKTYELLPDWLAKWGFGENPFGQTDLGHDSRGSLGYGMGGMGGGPFGVEAEIMNVSVPLAEEGTHQIVLRVLNPDGSYSDGPTQFVQSTPPPAPPISLYASDYDNSTQTLTLQIQ